MLRLIYIGLAVLYLIFGSGLRFNTHYCGAQVRYHSFTTFFSACCGSEGNVSCHASDKRNESIQGNCCKNIISEWSTDNNSFSSDISGKTFLSPPFYFIEYPTLNLTESTLNNTKKIARAGPERPVYLLQHQLLYYS